jgi:hypothetical protein
VVQVARKKRPRVREKPLYPLVQGYFEKREMQCWSEKELRIIQKRDRWGRFEAESHPTPDLVAVGSPIAEVIAVEIKGDAAPSKVDQCIGKLMRMLRFANKVYGAFQHPIPQSTIDTFRILMQSVPQVGLLEINPDNVEGAKELVVAAHGQPAVETEWAQYGQELGRAKALSEKKELGSELIASVKLDPESKRVIVEISDLAEDLFDAGDIDDERKP